MKNLFAGLIFLLALSYSLGETTTVPLCPAGNFYNLAAETCEKCQAGTFANGTIPQTECEPCSKGHIAEESGSSKCTFCGLGVYAVNRISCSNCPAGTTTIRGTSLDDCKPCPAGKVSGPGDICLPCGKDKYEVDRITCEKCPAGTFSKAENATSIETCQTCPAGSVSGQLSYLTNGCMKCYAGQYEVDRRLCKWCPEGTISTEGSTSCTACGFAQKADSLRRECEISLDSILFFLFCGFIVFILVILVIGLVCYCQERRLTNETSERMKEVNIKWTNEMSLQC